VKVEGTTIAEDASGTHTTKAATVNIEGGTVDIKGTPIKLNC